MNDLDPKPPSRRGFLKAVLGAAAVATVGVVHEAKEGLSDRLNEFRDFRSMDWESLKRYWRFLRHNPNVDQDKLFAHAYWLLGQDGTFR